MEDIEYLEEYEDLVLPGMSKQSKTVQHPADGEDSSSIDQDIFESLFDSRSDDETAVQKKDPKLNRREDRSSLDSLDMLVKDLGEQLPTSSDVLNQTEDKSSSSKPMKPNMKGQTKKEEKHQDLESKSDIKNKSNIVSLEKDKSVTFGKTIPNQNEQELISSTSRSGNVQSTTINPSLATSSKKFSTATSSTSVNKKKEPVQTIIKPEKPLSKDPADDPLAGIDSDTQSDLLGSASYTFSDMSDADDSYLSLSDIDNDDEQQLLDDLNPPIENLDQIEIPTVYNSSSTPSFNAHNVDEQASSSVNSNISQSRNVSNRSEKEKITILSNKVLDRLDTSLLESLTGVTSKISIGLDTKIETGTLNSVLHEIVEALPEQEKSITTTDTIATDTATVMRFDDVTTTTQDVSSVTSDVTNLFSSNYNSSDNLIKQSQGSNDTCFISTNEVSEQSNVTTTISESKTDQYSLTDSLCDAEPLANTSMKRTDSDSNNKRNTTSDTEKTSSSKDKAKTSRDNKINKKDTVDKTKDESFDIGVSELKDILLNESNIASEYNDDVVTTLQEIKDIYDEIDTQQKTNQIKEGKEAVLQDMEHKSSEGKTIPTESKSTKDLKPSIVFKKNSKVLKKDLTDFEKNSEEKLKETGAMKKTSINDEKQSTSQVNKKALDRKKSIEDTEVTNRANQEESVTDTEDNKKATEDKFLKNIKSTSHLNTSKIKKDQSNNDKKLNKEKRNEDKTNTTVSKDAKNSNLTLVSNTSQNKTNEEQITSQEAVKDTEINKKPALPSNPSKNYKTYKEKQLKSQETSKESEINKRSTLIAETEKNDKTSRDKQMTSQETIKETEVNKNTFFRSKDTLNLKSKINSPKQDKYAANDNKKAIPNDLKKSLDISEANPPENKETTNVKSKDSSKSPSKLLKTAQTNEDKKGNSKELRKDTDDKRVTSSDNKDFKNKLSKLSKEENINLPNEGIVDSKESKKDASSTETKDAKSLKPKEKINMSKQEKPIQKIVDKKSTVSLKLKTSTNKNVKEICNIETKNTSNIIEKSLNEVEKSRTKNKQEKSDEKRDMSTKTEIQLSVSKSKEEEKSESKGYSSSKDEDSDNLKLHITIKKFIENREEKNKTTPRKKDDQSNKKGTIKDSRNVSQQVQESTIGNQKNDKPPANEISMFSKNVKGSKEKVSTSTSVVTSEPTRGRKTEISIAQSPSKTRNPSESPKRANIQVKTKEEFKEPVEKLHKSGQDVQKPLFKESFEKSPSREHLSKSRSSSMSSEEKFSVGKPSSTQNKKESQGKKVELNKPQQKGEQGRKGTTPKQNIKLFNQHESPSRTRVETEKDSRRSHSQTTNTKTPIENRDFRRSNSQTITTKIETDNKDLRRSNSQTTNKRIESENRDLRRSNSQTVNTRIETDNRESRRSNFQSTNTKIGTENKDLRRTNSQINIRLETDNREPRQSDSQTTNVRIGTENKDSRRSNSHTLKMEALSTAVNIKTDKISLRKSEIKEPNQSSTIKPTVNVESSTSKNKKSVIQTNIEGSNDKNEIKPHVKIPNKISEKKTESKILPMPYANPQTNQKYVRDTSRESHKTPVLKIENKADTLSKTEPKVTPNVKKNQSTPQKTLIKKSSLESIANKITETQGSAKEKAIKDLQSQKDTREKKDSKWENEDLNISVKNDTSFDKDIKKGTQNLVSEDKLVDNKVEEINATSIPMVTKIKRDFNTRSVKNSDKEIESEEASKFNTSTAIAIKTKSIGKEPPTNKNNETEKEDEIVKVTKDLMGSTLLHCSVKIAKNSLEDIKIATDNEKNDSDIKEDGNEKIEKPVEQLKDEINLKTTQTVSSKLEKADNTENIDKSKSNSSNPTQTSDGEKPKLKSDKTDKNLMESNDVVSKNNTKPVRAMRNLRGKVDVIVNKSPKLKAQIESSTEPAQISTISNPKTLNEDHSRKHREQEGMDKSNIIEGIDPSRRSLRKRGTDSPMEIIDARKIFKEPTNTDIGRKDLNVRIDSPAPTKRTAAVMDSIATKSNEDQHPVKRQKLGILREIRGKSKDLHSETITSEEIEMVPSPIVSELLSGNRTTEIISYTTHVRETRSSSSLSVVDANLSESKDKDSSLDISKNIKNPLETPKKIIYPEIETSDTISSRSSNEEVVHKKLTRSQAASIVEEDKSSNFNMLTENVLKVGLEDLDYCIQDTSNKKNLRSKIITIDIVKPVEDPTLNYVNEDTSTASENSINLKTIDYLVQGNEEAKSINCGENSEEILKISHLDTNEANVLTEKLQSVVTEETLASASERIEICVEGGRKEKVNPNKVSNIKIFSDFEKPKHRFKEIDILRASMPLEMRESGFENMYSEGKLRTKSSLSVVSPIPNERTRIIKNRIMPERPASCISQIKNKSAKHKKQIQHDILKPKQLKKLRVRINRSVVDKYLKTINNTTEITKKQELNVKSSSAIRSRFRQKERDEYGHFVKSVLPKTVSAKTVPAKTVLAKTVLPKTKTTSEAKIELANSAGTSFISKAVEAAAASKEVIDRRAEKTPLVRLSQLNTHLRTRISEVSKGTLPFQQQQLQLPDFNTPTSSHQPEDVNKRVKTDYEDGNLLTPLKATAFTALRKQVTDEETKPSQQQSPERVSTLQMQMKDKLKNKLDKNSLTPALPTQSPVLASLINAKPTLPSPVLTEPNKEFTARINASSSATVNTRTPSTTSPKVLPFIEPKQEIEEYSSIAYNINSTPTNILSSTASSILPSSHQSTQSPVATLPTIITTGISPTIVDANGTRLYSFLHPAKYNRGYGGVLLDYCCPNLDGPMPAIDPTRIHARAQAVVRELPAYIVMTTKLITRADLETDKNSIPASIRHKVEMLTASSSTPTTSTQGPPALQPLQPPHLSSTINALQRQLPSTTTLTPKNIKSLQAANIADTPPSPATTSNLKTPVSLPEYQRSLLRSSVHRFDLTLTKFIQLNLSKMSFNERQRVVDTLSNLNKFSSKDIDCAIRLMEEYMLILNTPPPIIPSIQSTSSLTTVKTTAPQQKQIVNDMARKAKAPRPPQQRKLAVQKQQPQKEQEKNNEQYLPILDADQNIIGFKYQDVSSTSPVTKPSMSTRMEPSSTVPDLRSSTIKNLLKKSSAPTKNLKLPAQESPRIFYAKPPLQSSTPIQPKSTNTSLSLRSNQRSCLPYRQFNTPNTATSVTGPPPPKRPAISAAPISSLISSTPFGSLSVTSPTMTQTTTTTIASKSMILEPAPKRTTRTAAAAAASTTKVIIITSDQQADECILPDDTRSTAIKSENIDEDFIGGN